MVIHSTKQKTDNQIATIYAENAQLKQLVRTLKSDNLSLQKEIGKIKAKHITDINKVKSVIKPPIINFIGVDADKP